MLRYPGVIMKSPFQARTRAAAISIVVLSIVTFSGMSANAANQGSDPTAATDLAAHTTSELVTSQACMKAAQRSRSDALDTAICSVTVTTYVSAETTMSPEALVDAQASLSPAEYTSLVVAASAGTVHSRSYSQTINNITDEEKQYGTFYYDGSTVWVTDLYRGYRGSHHCVVNWQVGYSVSLQSCDESGSTSRKYVWMTWMFKPLSFPIGWTETYTLIVKADGSYLWG